MKTRTKENLMGCFVSGPSTIYGDSKEVQEFALKRGELFRSYIWDKSGISDVLKKLKHNDYGSDIVLVLFQFYLNPSSYELETLKEIESYRKRERAIGVPIIVDEQNFFAKSELEQRQFLKDIILGELDLLGEVVKKRKLDTMIESLKSDLSKILENY